MATPTRNLTYKDFVIEVQCKQTPLDDGGWQYDIYYAADNQQKGQLFRVSDGKQYIGADYAFDLAKQYIDNFTKTS